MNIKKILVTLPLILSMAVSALPASAAYGLSSSSDSGSSTAQSTAVVSFLGQVVSVDATANTLTGLVKVVYTKTSRVVAGAVGAGKTVTVKVPATITIYKAGVVVPLAAVQAGDLFKATVRINGTEVTASTLRVTSTNPKQISFSGKITALSLSADPQTMTVMLGSKSHTFTLNNATRVYTGKTPATLNELHVNDKVVLTYYTMNGAKVAAIVMKKK